jgi:hypothetical protein
MALIDNLKTLNFPWIDDWIGFSSISDAWDRCNDPIQLSWIIGTYISKLNNTQKLKLLNCSYEIESIIASSLPGSDITVSALNIVSNFLSNPTIGRLQMLNPARKHCVSAEIPFTPLAFVALFNWVAKKLAGSRTREQIKSRIFSIVKNYYTVSEFNI